MAEISIHKRPLNSQQWTAGEPESEEGAQTRKFLRKTANGRVRKATRERYLREQVGCGLPSCASCQDAHKQSRRDVKLSEGRDLGWLPSAQAFRDRGETPRFLLIDTNVVLHQIDILESTVTISQPGQGTRQEPGVIGIIILQTVLEEVRHRSLPLYNRLQALLREPSRACWVFWNEYCQSSAISTREGESPNDFNDRAIRTAAVWYSSHIRKLASTTSQSFNLAFVSDDADSSEQARALGLQTLSLREYVLSSPFSDQLVDLVAERSQELSVGMSSAHRTGASVYREHLSASQMEAGVSSGALTQGYFNASSYNYLEAMVRGIGSSQNILVLGKQAMNRAIDGDVVAVEILPEDQWRGSADDILDVDQLQKHDDAGSEEGEGGTTSAAQEELHDRTVASKTSTTKKQPTGRVVGIVRRNWRSYVTHIDVSTVSHEALSSTSQIAMFALPVDRKVPRIRFRSRQVATLTGQKLLVAIDSWPSTSKYPEGHLVRTLGSTESKETEQESLLLEYDIPYRPFSQAILDCLPSEGEGWKVPTREEGSIVWKDRIDLRDEAICSIDPPGCQDIDDALHAKLLPNGNVEAGVHIADVSYFVKPDTPMDAEAASRGTTVYLVDKRIDMLPHLLGTNLCSLRPFVERLAFSVIWELNSETGRIVKARFHKSVIQSKAAFTYEEAQKRKDDHTQTDEITGSIRLLNDMAVKLKQSRMRAGALNLASPEVRIHLDSPESSGPIDVEQKEMRETNSLVEEFMLLANISVARYIFDAFPQTAVLRRHVPPPKTNFETLTDILKKRRNFDLDSSSSGALASSLDRCVDASEPAFNTLVRIMTTRCMLSAEYFCSGSVSADTFGHYGLASEIYTHFTSPIRRYADVLAHRQLAAAIHHAPLHPSLHSKVFVDDVLQVVNRRHRTAQMAGRASVEFYVGLSIAQKRIEVKAFPMAEASFIEEAFVIRAFRNGISVFVDRYGLEGLITFKEDCMYDADNYQVIIPSIVSGLERDVTLGVFDRCRVDIRVEKDRNTQRGKVKMVLVN